MLKAAVSYHCNSVIATRKLETCSNERRGEIRTISQSGESNQRWDYSLVRHSERLTKLFAAWHLIEYSRVNSVIEIKSAKKG